MTIADAAPPLVAVSGGDVSIRDARRNVEHVITLEPFEIGTVPVSARDFGTQNAHERMPATAVTWLDAIAWCNAISEVAGLAPAYHQENSLFWWDPATDGYRLPTVAEWEYACRAGTDGPTYGPLADIAWTAGDSVDGPQPLGGKRANHFGLFDMLGNVWEWCWDYADPARYSDYRTLKGGGWADEAWSCRVGVRRASAPDARLEDVGFRVARGPAMGNDGWFQGWSLEEDRHRADIRGALPMGWTPLRELTG